MKVCIVGAGAIGGFLGARLAASGQCEVSALARGATLQALRTHGWRLQLDNELLQRPVTASDNPLELGAQDLVIVAVKGPALAAVAPSVAAMLGSNTMVLPAMNGVPWWFSQDVAALGGQPLESIDAGGRIAQQIPLHHVVGCVVHASTFTTEPGLVQHKMGRGLIVGEPHGAPQERTERLGALLTQAGFEVTVSSNIRYDIWYKLWGNMTVNPVSAITGASMDKIQADPLVLEFCSAAMREAAAIGERIGCVVTQSPEERHAVTRKLGAFKTSMLQDVEAGRPLELDALVGAVREMGQRVGVFTPNIDALMGLTQLFGRVHGLYPKV
ncbi:MAG: 2-dehydropantoate 2-reductase [Burkholderiaceae bacterium]|nr:2-dehydropantoate 2-reductase [Burkholderiaceae bacterium]